MEPENPGYIDLGMYKSLIIDRIDSDYQIDRSSHELLDGDSG